MDRHIRVLIVEDNPDHAEVIARLLASEESFRYVTEQVTTVADAIAKVKQGGIDAVLLDLSLPDGIGVDVIRRVKYAIDASSTTKILVLTGWGGPEIIPVAKELGAEDVLTKPADPADLTARLTSIVIRGRLEKTPHPIEATLAKMGSILWRLGELMDKAVKED